jgi:hypothetical protein
MSYRCEPRVDTRYGVPFTWRADKKTPPQLPSAPRVDARTLAPAGDAASALASLCAEAVLLSPRLRPKGGDGDGGGGAGAGAPSATPSGADVVACVCPIEWSAAGALRVASVAAHARSAVRCASRAPPRVRAPRVRAPTSMRACAGVQRGTGWDCDMPACERRWTVGRHWLVGWHRVHLDGALPCMPRFLVVNFCALAPDVANHVRAAAGGAVAGVPQPEKARAAACCGALTTDWFVRRLRCHLCGAGRLACLPRACTAVHVSEAVDAVLVGRADGSVRSYVLRGCLRCATLTS